MTGWSFPTPLIVRQFVPTPVIFAPASFRKWQSCVISGSCAALYRTVVPSANTAAMSTFSVAPTLGNGRQISAPFSPSVSARICFSSLRKRTPIQVSAVSWISTGRLPIIQPPGRSILTLPHLPSRGPSSMTEERMALTCFAGQSDVCKEEASMITAAPSLFTRHPSVFNNPSISSISVICGQL